MITKNISGLLVKIFDSRDELGKAAAKDVTRKIHELLSEKDEIRMIFAAAPSQEEMLKNLVTSNEVDWTRITAFHMDEYIGLADDVPQLFSTFLKERLFNHVPLKTVHLINGNGGENECIRYTNLIKEAPIDIVCLGIGENGHIAFNDPPVADFYDNEIIKPVQLDMACRQQQVNDGCFATPDDVPLEALTLTIPAMMSASHLFCVVPGKTKREAVYKTLYGDISTDCPASILRRHLNCVLYLDQDSYGER